MRKHRWVPSPSPDLKSRRIGVGHLQACGLCHRPQTGEPRRFFTLKVSSRVATRFLLKRRLGRNAAACIFSNHLIQFSSRLASTCHLWTVFFCFKRSHLVLGLFLMLTPRRSGGLSFFMIFTPPGPHSGAKIEPRGTRNASRGASRARRVASVGLGGRGECARGKKSFFSLRKR